MTFLKKRNKTWLTNNIWTREDENNFEHLSLKKMALVL